MKPPAAIAGIMLPLTAIVVVAGWMMMRSVDAYFPPEIIDDDVCADLTPKPGAVLDAMEAGRYGGDLRELGEMPMAAGVNGGRPVMRFLLLPSFQAAISVRIEQQADGTAVLSASRGVGRDGCRPGASDCRVARRLSAEEWARISAWRAPLSAMQPADCFFGLDGTRWVHEVREGDQYRLVHRWAPEDDAVFRAGVAMLRATGWRLETAGEWRPSEFREYARRQRREEEAALSTGPPATPPTPPPAPSPAAP